MKRAIASVVITTAYLLVYNIVTHSSVHEVWPMLLFTLSPFFVIWMVYIVLRHGEYNGPELRADQEYGYQDRPEGIDSTF
jgi:hypothetical protein